MRSKDQYLDMMEAQAAEAFARARQETARQLDYMEGDKRVPAAVPMIVVHDPAGVTLYDPFAPFTTSI